MRQFVLAALLAIVLTACGGKNKGPVVVLETELGNIEIKVNEKKAPISSKDFLIYVDEGLYDGQTFYRTVKPETDPLDMGMELIQGGRADTIPLTAGVAHETTEATGLSNVSGSVSLARDAPGTGSAAFFFINIADNTFLDTGGKRNPDGQGYAVFGEVTSGMDTVRAIQAREAIADPSAKDGPAQYLAAPITITKAYRK